ncbi:ankyrin repeat domain-containing protein SOWAHB-like [Sardina pilchardus]|uniref:ankyrin repeat domain-containing protein SOWAHB-like n=1 Tax=Sardina pilchardus TaxID=27697 RepID=UPI002E1598E4
MATDFTQESLLGFLRCNGGRVKNAELLGHFKYFLKEDENRVQNRERFKTFVNAVAVVKHEDGVSYIVLRKKFKVPGGDIGSVHIPKRQEEKLESSRSRHRDRSPRWATSRSRERRVPGETSSNLKTNKAAQVPTSVASESTVEILPVAGILINNNNNAETVNFEKTVKMSPPQTWESSPPSIIITEANRTLKPLLTPPFSSESKRSSGSGQSFEQAWDKEPVETTHLEHNSVDISNLGQSREADGCSTIFCSPPSSIHSDLQTYSLEELRHSPELQQPQRGTRGRNLGTQPAPWPPHPSLYNTPGIYSSSPCIADITPAPLTKAGHQMSSSNDCLTPKREPLDHVHRESLHIRAAAAINSPHQRRSLPLEPSYMPDAAAAASPEPLYHTPLSSTHGCLPESDCKWPFPLTQESWSSDDSLNQRVMEAPGDQLREMLQRAHDAKLLTLLHRPERAQAPGYHRSTGYLDQETPRSRAGAPGSVPEHLRRAPSRCVSQHQRNRISRSLGAGLDQPFPDDNEVARQNRLLLLSSSLSINYPLATTPDRCSSRELSLSGASSTASLSPCHHDQAFIHRSSTVPLEAREHEWMVKAAAGDWPVIYSLFREDAGLLFKKDFISGFTVLHWIAQHGDHRVLNTLWYGVSKAGMTLEVDARTNSGYTPLHLAAMYGHRKLIRLLVHKFKANVRLRDTSGRRAWQYLGKDATKEMLEILGAPQKKRGAKSPPQTHVDKPSERPATVSAAVKRHSSLAALFKHKSLGRIAGHTEMSV